MLTTILRGMEARERLVRQSLTSVSGTWVVEEQQGEEITVASSAPEGAARTTGVPGPAAKQRSRLVRSLFADEKYREEWRALPGEEQSETDALGYDGRRYWRHQNGARTSPRLASSSTAAAVYTGVNAMLASGGASRSASSRYPNARLVGEEMVGGYRCHHIAYGDDAAEREVWVAAKLGCAVVRQVSVSKGAVPVRITLEYRDFRPATSKLWLPWSYQKATEELGPKGERKLLVRIAARAEDITVNAPVPPGAFAEPKE